MNKAELDIVHKAMATDLTKVVKWYKTIEFLPMPPHFKPFDEKFWKAISSEIFYIEEPIQIDKDFAVLRFSPGYGVLVQDTQENFPPWVYSMNTMRTSIDYSQRMVRKLSFIAYNFMEIKQFFQGSLVDLTPLQQRSKSESHFERGMNHYNDVMKAK